MYSTVKSAIKYNRETSNYITSNLDVKQGDPISSLLFMMFVNDILANINSNLDGIFTVNEIKIFLIFYADDQVLFSTSPTSLQSMLSDIEEYCNTWGLRININKIKVLIFEKDGWSTHYNFYLYNEKLEIVSSFKHLGVYVFKNGHWNRTQKKHSRTCIKSITQTFLKTLDKCKLFDILVASVLNYASET